MKFEDYLTEAFGARSVPFGTNSEADNGQFDCYGHLVTTELIYKGNRFRVGYSGEDGTVTFTNRNDGSNKIAPVREAKTGLDFYNRIGFVLLKVLDYSKAKSFRFEGTHDDDLRDLYIKFVNNRSFVSAFKAHGWQYCGEKYEGLYLFKRVNK